MFRQGSAQRTEDLPTRYAETVNLSGCSQLVRRKCPNCLYLAHRDLLSRHANFVDLFLHSIL